MKAKTADGYTLTLFNIKGRVAEGYYPKGQPPVLMVPGIFDDGARWLMT